MDGLHLLLHHILGLWLSGMTKGLSIEQFLNSSGMIFNRFLFYANIFTLLNSLTHAHDGQYLAEVTANCLKRFQLDKFVRQFLLKFLS
jgi:hypothetical protein